MQSLAPIAILIYARLEHLKQTVEALQRNHLAKESTIYFFSDAPKRGDEKKVQKVREYLKTVTGFKKIYIEERKTNNFLENTVGNLEKILKQYGKGIILEEDIVVAPGFLEYMNDALNYYEEDHRVFSISGYSPPIKLPENYSKDYFTLRRFSGWGVGLWETKYFKTGKLTKQEFERADKYEIAKYGFDLLTMMEMQVHKKLNAHDVNMIFHQFKTQELTLYPRQSLVQNIGHDGSGMHCGASKKFHVKLWEETDFIFDEKIELNPEIVRENFKFRFVLNDYSMSFLVDGLIRKLNESESQSFSVWGLGKMTQLLVANMPNLHKQIHDFLDSSADTKELIFEGMRVVTPEAALLKGERSFVIASWENRIKLQDILVDLAKKHNIEDIEIIVPEISFP